MSLKNISLYRVQSLLLIVLFMPACRQPWARSLPKSGKIPLTGLMWTVEDSGTDLNWNQANANCEELTWAVIRTGDWRRWRNGKAITTEG